MNVQKNFSFSKFKEECEFTDEKPVINYNVNKNLLLDKQRKLLPIYKYKDQILFAIEKYSVLIIDAETGTGKSTQIAQYLCEAGYSDAEDKTYLIGVTQPRRVAATTLAKRVSEEMKCKLGEKVGYSIRFEDCVKIGKTKIKFMTEGILIREIMSDPLLNDYSVIMIDETHERTIYTDIILGLLKKILLKRREMKLIISSATIQTKSYLDYFSCKDYKVTTLKIQERTYPVDVYFLKEPIADYLKASVDCVIKIHETQKKGDILVFLTGQEEVERVVEILKTYAKNFNEEKDFKLYILPFYSALPAYEQLKVFERFSKNVRKVIVSTNLAETSLTISNIVYVVECGFVKMRFFNNLTCTDALIVVPISKASSKQRAGRAGRNLPGKVFRLYTQQDYEKFNKFTIPELQRIDLSQMILQLKALGIKNILNFDFLSRPPEANIVMALEFLYSLGCLNESGDLKGDLGLKMAEFPLLPQFSKMLLVSEDFGCSDEILTICSMLQVDNIYIQPSSSQRSIQARNAKYNFSVQEGDTITYLNIFNSFIKAEKIRNWADRNYLNYNALLRVLEIRKRLSILLKRMKIKIISANGNLEKIQKCIITGFFANAAKLQYDGSYKLIRGDYILNIHPSSVLIASTRLPEFVLFTQVTHTSKAFMKNLTTIQQEWLYEIAPHFYDFGTDREVAEKRFNKNS